MTRRLKVVTTPKVRPCRRLGVTRAVVYVGRESQAPPESLPEGTMGILVEDVRRQWRLVVGAWSVPLWGMQ